MVYFLKFSHLLFALGILSGMMYSFLTGRTNSILLLFCLLAAVTGTFLVYPKHYTFHTPWIQAAYALTLLVSLGIGVMLAKKKSSRLIFFILIVALILITHDAVTKTILF